MEFVHVMGDHRIAPNTEPVTIAPRKFGHMTLSFRGRKHVIVDEGSRLVIHGMPDDITMNERSDLASHGFIYAGMVTAEMVNESVRKEAGTSDLKGALEHESAMRAAEMRVPAPVGDGMPVDNAVMRRGVMDHDPMMGSPMPVSDQAPMPDTSAAPPRKKPTN